MKVNRDFCMLADLMCPRERTACYWTIAPILRLCAPCYEARFGVAP